jgi:hypothetical protein
MGSVLSLDPEDRGIMLLQNVNNYVPINLMSYTKKLESSKAPLSEPKILQQNYFFIQIFWVMVLCSLVGRHHISEENYTSISIRVTGEDVYMLYR